MKDVVFKKYTIINKSREIIEDMYLSYWSDDDLGDAGDDYVGCDTTLNLGFIYNGDDYDDVYGSAPPAVGHMVVQGPVQKGESEDSAMFMGNWIKGFNNIAHECFYIF